MENQKKIRITNQLKEILENCTDSELAICTAYYVPNEQEVDDYLKQGDYNIQLNNLLNGNNSLVERMPSATKQREFTNLLNNSLTDEIGFEARFDKPAITNMILSLLSPVINSQDRSKYKELIETKKIVEDIKSRVEKTVERKLNIVTGIKQILQIKLQRVLGLSQSQYNQISGGISVLAQNIEKKLIDDGFVIKKIDLSQKKEELKNIKWSMLNDPTYLSTIPPISNEKHIPKELIIQRIINAIMYKSASDPLKIEVNKSEGYIKVNEEILPITVYEEILNILETNTEKAFRNINMYLTSSDTIFTDQFNRKYILHIDDTHILGIEKTTTFLRTLAAKKIYESNKAKYNSLNTIVEADGNYERLTKEELEFYLTCKKYLDNKRFCENIEDKIKTISNKVIPKVNPPLLKNGTKILFGPNIEKVSSIFTVYNHLYKLSDEVPTTEAQITAQIECISIIQGKLSEIMSDQRDNKVFERLVYFLIKDVSNPIEVLKSITEKQLNEIFESNMCLFSNEYYMKFKENPSELIEKISTLTEDKITKIKDKYNEIFEIQNYLDYKYKVISQSIIKNVPYDKWSKYFSGKHANEKGELSTDRIGPFGIAQLLLENEIQEHKTAIKNGTSITNSIFNLFKVDDKTYYIINFNFVTDLKRIFIVNTKNGVSEYHIICEMDACDERVVAYFDEVNKNGVAHFYSVQNTEDILMSSFSKSKLSSAIDFKGKEFSTMLVFSESSVDQRITQHYTSAKGKVASISNFVKYLLEGRIDLRTATSLNVEGDYSQDSKKNISDFLQGLINRKKTLTKSEMNELSMIGCSNADQMIENMTLEEVQKFIGLESITPIELELVKSTLKLKNLQKLHEALIIKIDEITNSLVRNSNPPLPGENDNSYINTTDQAKKQQKENELIALQKLLTSTAKTIKTYKEVLLQKDTNNKIIPFDTSQNVKEYFEKNIYGFDINDTQILKYLAQRSKELGDNELFERISNHITFTQLLSEERTKFESEYERVCSIHRYLRGTTSEQVRVSAIVNNIQHTKPIESFDIDVLIAKKEILDDLLEKINMSIPDIGDDKYKYLELADRELSSIIKVRGSIATKTIFEKTIELKKQKKKVDLEREVFAAKNAFNTNVKTLITNDSITLEEKIARIVKASKEYISKVNSYKEQYAFDGSNEISKYIFAIEASSRQEEYSNQKFAIFNSVFEENCSITEIADLILRKLQESIMLIYHEYVNTGSILYEHETRELESALNYRKKQQRYRERISSKVTTSVLAIQRLYNEMVRYNAAIEDNRKDAIADIIERKMSSIKVEIDKVTKSSVFSMGTNGLVKNQHETSNSFLPSQEQIEFQLMAVDGETVVMPKH